MKLKFSTFPLLGIFAALLFQSLEITRAAEIKPWPVVKAAASATWEQPGFGPEKAVDGNLSTYWNAPENATNSWLEVDLGSERSVQGIMVSEYQAKRIRAFDIQAKEGGEWKTITSGQEVGDEKEINLPQPVQAQFFRINIREATRSPVIYEFQLFEQRIAPNEKTIEINPVSSGRVFEGIGAVSASSSMQLRNYPEPYRGDILDLIFRPKFGAGFQHLKVEVGSGMSSSCTAEPSHAITPEEAKKPVPRGYELWLASEARKRNPKILLECLPWGTPYWTTDYTTKEAADWLIAFLNVAKKSYGLDFQYVAGSLNENCNSGPQNFANFTPAMRNYTVNFLRPALDKNGYKDVKIVYGELYNRFPGKEWYAIKDYLAHPELGKAITAIGVHYPVGWMTTAADWRPLPPGTLESGMRLWATEDYSCEGGNFGLGLLYVRNIFREYNELRMTKSEVWAPFSSIPDGVMYSNVGFLKAAESWSGHYEAWPALWAVAHITQFAEPGWRYLDNAQGRFKDDSFNAAYATLLAPNAKDWSFIAVTDNKSKTVTLNIDPALKQKTIHVWKSDAKEQFVEQTSRTPQDGKMTIALSPNSIYSLTTTTGQRKGEPVHKIPDSAPAKAWSDDLKSYSIHDTPKYWVNQEGTFEIVKDDNKNVIQQIVPKVGHAWPSAPSKGLCYSIFAGMKPSRDFTFKISARIQDGFLDIGAASGQERILYCRLEKAGQWHLINRNKVLASGQLAGSVKDGWHDFSIVYRGSAGAPAVQLSIDGKTTFDALTGDTNGGAYVPYIGSSYNANAFADIVIIP